MQKLKGYDDLKNVEWERLLYFSPIYIWWRFSSADCLTKHRHYTCCTRNTISVQLLYFLDPHDLYWLKQREKRQFELKKAEFNEKKLPLIRNSNVLGATSRRKHSGGALVSESNFSWSPMIYIGSKKERETLDPDRAELGSRRLVQRKKAAIVMRECLLAPTIQEAEETIHITQFQSLYFLERNILQNCFIHFDCFSG